MNSYKLTILDDSNAEWIPEQYVYAGSDPSCNITITEAQVERRHALIEKRNDGLFIKDLRSFTGVSVNGTRIIEAKLFDGDLIGIGSKEILVSELGKVKKTFPLESKNEYWQMQLQQLAGVADTRFPVLLLGPSGTGKDVIAQALHFNSLYKNHPFVSVNCSALTETLVESELFGHVKGSFTGAIGDRKGAFETARGGTLFLDEIGDLPLSMQAKLLRALENNEIRPVGSDRSIKTQVRIVAATHQNLFEKVEEGSFRGDLFYRLNVITIHVPALKDRMEDFETLLYQFAKKLRVRFSHNAIAALKKYAWKGNIRELKNLVARASAIYPTEYLQESHVKSLMNPRSDGFESCLSPQAGQMQVSVIKEIERQMILKRLAANRGNQKRTATDLGIPKSTLHDRIKTYNIKPEEFKPL